MVQLAEVFARQVLEAREVADEATLVTLNASDAARVMAALGMAVRHATEHLDDDLADAIGIVNDAADSVVRIGTALAASGGDQSEFGGQGVVIARGVLTHTIDKLRQMRWVCPCPDQHGNGIVCRGQRQLTEDLARLGGWIVSPDEAPGSAR